MSDYKLVPVDPTPEMVEAAEDAYMPFGDMEMAIRMALLAAPAVQGEPTLVAWVLYDATADQKYIKKNPDDGSLAIFDSEAAARRARTMHRGSDYKRVDYYTAPQPAEHRPCPEGVREGAPYDDPAFESLCREYGIWGTAAAAQCAAFWGAGKRAAEQQPSPHPDDAAVDRFAAAMKAKLTKKRQEGRGGWQSMTAEQLSALLHEHVHKGDPLDVANLAMMLHQNGQRIEQQPAPDVAGLVEALESAKNLIANHSGEVLPDEYAGDQIEQIDAALAPYRKGGEV